MSVGLLSLAGASIAFQGNPNVTITAIDTSGGIVFSRTSGKTPCFIMASASAITATGTSDPYADLSYSWDFNDPSGTENLTNAATGISVNANNGQTGPEAAYCYRTPGTYHPKLTVSGKNGSGLTTTTVTYLPGIVVTAFSALAANTWYYDQFATSGANDGTSAANAFTSSTALSDTVSKLTTKINGATGNGFTQIYLARGNVWDSTAFVDANTTTGLRVEPTPGSVGADPVIQCSLDTGGRPLVWIRVTDGGSFADFVMRNVGLKVTGSTFTGTSLFAAGINTISNGTRTISDVYLDNCSFTTGMSGGSAVLTWVSAQFTQSIASGNFDRFGMWGGSINSLAGDVAVGTGFFGGARNWTFMMGLSNVNGAGSSPYIGHEHHFYSAAGNHCLYRWINFGSSYVGPDATRNYCVKVDNYPPPKFNVTAGGYSQGASNGSGGFYIRVNLQIANGGDTSQYTNGATVYIENVSGTGASDVLSAGCTLTGSLGQGIWPCSIISTTQMDLVGTLYNAGHTYTGGDVSATQGTNYVCVDGNNITGTHASFDAQNNYGSIFSSWISNYVVQSNAVHDIPYDGAIGVWPIVKSLTYRDNRQWNLLYRNINFSQGNIPPKDHGITTKQYRNYLHIASNILGGDNTHVPICFAASGVSWINPQQFTYNITVDMRSGTSPNGAGIVALDDYSADAAWLINFNQYYAPNATANKFFYNGTTITTFGVWQGAGFDLNGQQLGAYPFLVDPPTSWQSFGP